ncbi:response regulator [Paenibacillus sp. NPDC058071]|uniref:response regulator n=1 Tax=Paenibacillus sp. NPDC058071 TaxID=3346326 RepID=UPI0036DD7A6B
MNANPIRVMLVEDDEDWIAAMTDFLNREPDMSVVGSAASGPEALRTAESLVFDVALLDIHLGDGSLDGINAAIELQELRPDAKLIMLSSVGESEVMTRAFTAGAVNYIEKTDFRELPHAIRHAVLHPKAMDALLKEFGRLKREEQLKELTVAEREVYDLLEEGMTGSQIEKKLFKAESTLKNQVNRMLKKLGVRSSKEAVRKVKRKGLL